MRGERFALALPLAVLISGCTGEIGNPGVYDDAGPQPDADPNAPDATPGGPDAMPGTPDASRADAGPVVCSETGGDRLAQVCRRWVCDTMDLSEGTWSGSTATCTAGDISATGRANALKLVNVYRFLGDLPEVTTDPGFDQAAQACSLMIDANSALNHDPPTSWNCYSALGAGGAMTSNEATTAAVTAIPLYMVDPGNPTTIGHRRWLLSNSLGPIGVGSTDSWSCLKVIGGSGSAGHAWTAWPPPGPFPVDAMFDAFGQSVDSTGWSVQSDSIDLDGANVQVVRDGTDTMSVTVAHLLPYYGSMWALTFTPQGWTMQAGHTYAITLTGVTTPISYTVEAVGCPAP
jgi:uncharacterized protein YkwD